MKEVTLNNGAKEADVLVAATMMSLKSLLQSAPIAFYELVQLCRNPNHRLFGNAGEILKKYGLVHNGVVHDSFRNVVLSAVKGDGLNMQLTSPIKT